MWWQWKAANVIWKGGCGSKSALNRKCWEKRLKSEELQNYEKRERVRTKRQEKIIVGKAEKE